MDKAYQEGFGEGEVSPFDALDDFVDSCPGIIEPNDLSERIRDIERRVAILEALVG